jgi:hypothetical protein
MIPLEDQGVTDNQSRPSLKLNSFDTVSGSRITLFESGVISLRRLRMPGERVLLYRLVVSI